MKRLLLALALVGASSADAGEALPGANVESLLELARSQNPELASMRFEAQAAAERVAPAAALPDPGLRVELMDVTNRGQEASPNLLPGRVGATKYTLTQSLPFWGKRELRRDVASLGAEQAQIRAAGLWAELAARVKSAYAQYYLAGRSLALTREMLDLAGGLERIAQARYAQGLAPQQDVLRAQVEQATMQAELIRMQMESHHAYSRLNTLLARPAMAPLAEAQALRPLPVNLDPGQLGQRLQAGSPALAVERSRVAQAEKSRELALRNRYPDFTVGVAPTQMNGRVAEWGVMLEMNLPLQQGTRRAEERETLALASAAAARRDTVLAQLQGSLADSLASLEAARRIEHLTRTSLQPQAELNYQAALVAYQNGKVDFATLLEAQRQIRRNRLELLKAQVEGQERLADIERLLGEDL